MDAGLLLLHSHGKLYFKGLFSDHLLAKLQICHFRFDILVVVLLHRRDSASYSSYLLLLMRYAPCAETVKQGHTSCEKASLSITSCLSDLI